MGSIAKVTDGARRSEIDLRFGHDAEMRERDALYAEMRQCNWMIYATTWICLALMFYFSTTPDWGFMVILVGLAWIFSMARYDYLIHRIGAFLRDEHHGLWETSRQRNKDKWVLALADIGCAIPIIYLYGSAVYALWDGGARQTASFAVTVALLGTTLLVYASTMHARTANGPAGNDGPVK